MIGHPKPQSRAFTKQGSCEHCGGEFTPYRKPQRQRFCSTRCAYEARVAKRPKCPVCGKQRPRGTRSQSRMFRKQLVRKQKACPHCGELFWPKTNGRRPLSKHCSLKCRWAEQHKRPALIEAACVVCGATFRRSLAAVKRVANVFCSLDCARNFNRGENHYSFRGDHDPNRGSQWVRLAESIRKRDGYVCQRCTKTQVENKQKLSVDHILPWRAFDDKTEANQPSNLVSLCRSCHTKKTWIAEQAWLRGDRIAMEQYKRSVTLPPLFATVTLDRESSR